MNVLEVLVILTGISLDVFGAMECCGSLVARIEKKQLAVISSILAAGQMIFLGMGSALSWFVCQGRARTGELFLGQVAAAGIFLCLGLRLIVKAWKNEEIVEHRQEKIEVWKMFKLYIHGSLFTLLTGIALGFLGNDILILLLLTIALTVLAAVFGMYTGYRLGYEHKMKAYVLGGFLLIAGSVDVFVRNYM